MLPRVALVALLLASLPAMEAFSGSPAVFLGSRCSVQRLRSADRPSVLRKHGGACCQPAMQTSGNGSPDLVDMATLIGASLARPGAGAFVAGYRAEPAEGYKNPTMDLPIREFSETLPSFRPEQPLQLYEYEACPFCRKVREAVSMLDLDVIVYPCPRDGTRYREKVSDMGGKAQFPYIVDPNTKFASYESDRIIRYLFQTYGDGIVPLPLSLGPLTTTSAALASALRAGKGRQALSNLPTPPEMPLELWSYEASPFCRVVREKLCELELAHKVITVARGSSKREKLVALAGKVQVPYLVDPNTGAQMFESADIISYLERTYGSGSSPIPVRSGAGSGAGDDVAAAAAAASQAQAKPKEGTQTVTVDVELMDVPSPDDKQ